MLTREIRQSGITSKKIAATATIQARNKRTKEALIGHLAVDNVTVQGPMKLCR